MEGGAPGPLLQLVPFVAIFAIFYFLMIAPMRKRQKALQNLVQNLKKGDAVITQGGLYGEVASLRDDSVVLKLGENVKVRVARSAISGMQADDNGGAS
jgi:preprotein translocase subunit YajC